MANNPYLPCFDQSLEEKSKTQHSPPDRRWMRRLVEVFNNHALVVVVDTGFEFPKEHFVTPTSKRHLGKESSVSDHVTILNKLFLMPIEEVFSIQNRGPIVTRRIEQGAIKIGKDVEVIEDPPTKHTVIGVETMQDKVIIVANKTNRRARAWATMFQHRNGHYDSCG
ncbi:hypothetical protein SUGI_0699970 [Cryptomeria japonica]|nr:hypothetical protein SUGI_0699970 [Cryptomeria japonica]